MRASLLSALGAAFYFVGTNTYALAQDDAKAAILAAWQPVAAALTTGVDAEVAKVSTADFQFVDVFGRPGPAGQWAVRNNAVLANAKTPTVVGDVVSVTPKGDAVVALLKAKLTGIGLDRLGMEGPLDMTIIYRTEWVKADGKWKIKLAKEGLFTGTANKRPVKLTTSAAEDMVRTQFQPLLGGLAEAYEKQNFADIEKGLPPDYEIYDMEGAKLSPKETLDRVKAGQKVLQNPLVTFDPQQVLLDGDRVVLVRVCKIIGEVSLPNGMMGRVIYTQCAREVFIKGEKGFVPKSTAELHAEASLNGMPLPLALISGKP
jgi:hypothetical protein